MNSAQLLSHFDRLTEAPDAIPRLRRFIFDLAVRGKLVEQDPRDEPASELLKRIQGEKTRLLKEGKIKGLKPLAITDTAKEIYKIPSSWKLVPLGETVNSHLWRRHPVEEQFDILGGRHPLGECEGCGQREVYRRDN